MVTFEQIKEWVQEKGDDEIVGIGRSCRECVVARAIHDITGEKAVVLSGGSYIQQAQSFRLDFNTQKYISEMDRVRPPELLQWEITGQAAKLGLMMAEGFPVN